MTKSSLHVKIACIFLALFVAVFATGTVFAWFSSQQWNLDIMGNTVGAYFAYGDGTDTKLTYNKETWDGKNEAEWDKGTGPFGITHPEHMYNLSWLQNNGFFDDGYDDEEFKPYHFELGDNVDMRESGKTVVIPPIGNNNSPFNGVFNGNGHAISNLVVSTNRDVLDASYANAVFANAVGLFGMTAQVSKISNFILDYPTVEVADTATANTAYTNISDENYANDTNDTLAAGLAVGYVAGTVHSIGVMGGTLAVRRQNYSTFNSILGELDPNTKEDHDHNVTGSGSSGTGNAFGATFDIASIYDRLEKIAGNVDANGKQQAFRLPNVIIDKDNNGNILDVHLDKYEKLPFTVVASQSTYSGPDAAEVISVDNIGYLLGDKNQADTDTYTFKDKLVKTNSGYLYSDGSTPNDYKKTLPRWIYKQTGTYAGAEQYNAIVPLTQTEFNELPEDVRNILPPEGTNTSTLEFFKVGGPYKNTGVQMYPQYPGEPQDHQWTVYGQIEWNGGKYGRGIEKNGWVADEEGYYIDEGGHIMDDTGYIFRWEENANGKRTKNYAAGIDHPNALLNPDGTITDKYGSGIVRYRNPDGSAGKIFNAFEGDYEIAVIGGKDYIVDRNGNRVQVKDIYNNDAYLVPITGTKMEMIHFLEGVALPLNGMWFKPVKEGTIRLLMFGDSTEGQAGFTLVRLKRTLATEENPFAYDMTYNDFNGGIVKVPKPGDDSQYPGEKKYTVPNNVLVFLELEFTQDDIDNGYEFWLTGSDAAAAQPRFIYMDLGASEASEDNEDTDVVNPDKRVSSIDFIYDGVTITQTDEKDAETDRDIPKGSFIINNADGSKSIYVETDTMISFGTDNGGAIIAFYYRKGKDLQPDNDGYTIYAAYTATNNSLVSSRDGKAYIGNNGANIPGKWPGIVDGEHDYKGWVINRT